MEPIPYGRQWIDDDDVAAVVAVLRGDWLTQGPAVEAFEDALRAVTGARHAVCLSSGTAALHAACWAAGLGPGDVVATSPLSFAASANAARYVGAEVAFVDVEPDTWNLDPSRVPADAAAVVAVHYAGLPVDLRRLSRRPRVVIEDAAHAIGAVTPDGPVGNCAHSDLCCFSFHPVKTVTTGEGGAVTTNDDALAERLRRFRHHGIVARPDEGGWVYDIPELGYNYRLTDVQAALGTSQLAKLERFVARRNELAGRYRALLVDLDVGLPPAAPAGFRHAYHLFPVHVAHRRRVYDHLRRNGIGTQVHYVPTYRFGAYSSQRARALPHTDALYAGLLSLPLFPALRHDDQDRVVAELAAALEAAP
jgi:UDP-4-amino-4,6-dideoxy-N-acetyl-beta-L-altrosamine transaminase